LGLELDAKGFRALEGSETEPTVLTSLKCATAANILKSDLEKERCHKSPQRMLTRTELAA
jgi:hypothetical protein